MPGTRTSRMVSDPADRRQTIQWGDTLNHRSLAAGFPIPRHDSPPSPYRRIYVRLPKQNEITESIWALQ